jgi:DnaJ-class molecular chaperone
MTCRRACVVLGLGGGRLADLTREGVHRRYRELARRHHPDLGGDRAAWDELLLAYQTLLAEMARPRCCPSCRGSKTQASFVKGRLVSVPCHFCGGEGLVTNQ